MRWKSVPTDRLHVLFLVHLGNPTGFLSSEHRGIMQRRHGTVRWDAVVTPRLYYDAYIVMRRKSVPTNRLYVLFLVHLRNPTGLLPLEGPARGWPMEAMPDPLPSPTPFLFVCLFVFWRQLCSCSMRVLVESNCCIGNLFCFCLFPLIQFCCCFFFFFVPFVSPWSFSRAWTIVAHWYYASSVSCVWVTLFLSLSFLCFCLNT